jgi:hypothetical protein
MKAATHLESVKACLPCIHSIEESAFVENLDLLIFVTVEEKSAVKNEIVVVRAPASFDAANIIDKQPLNFWHLGLVAIAMPNAKIVHCTRDIRDNGFSIFSQNFHLSQKWSTDLTDIAHYWRGYRRLMAHWQSVTGLDILEVNYEDTVADLEVQARRLLGFVGLSWDEKVLAFHENSRPVQTPSRWQVRQPLYRTSMEKWRQYEQHLQPLIDAEAGK